MPILRKFRQFSRACAQNAMEAWGFPPFALKSPDDARRVLAARANGVLIGEALMRAHHPPRETGACPEISAGS